jgi:hypothetical protein
LRSTARIGISLLWIFSIFHFPESRDDVLMRNRARSGDLGYDPTTLIAQREARAHAG